MADAPVLTLFRGGSIVFTFAWPDGEGGGANLTGWSLEVFEAHPLLVPHVTAQIVDHATGLVRGQILWAATMLDGAIMAFRLRITHPGQPPRAFPAFTVDVR